MCTSDATERFGLGPLVFAAFVTLALAVVSPAAAQDHAAETRKRLAAAAEAQVGVTLVYDPAYVRLTYPGGDVPRERGVCADVVVRAFRAIGVDLQVTLHDDMSRHFPDYPQLWGLRGPDANIDHRRVPNLMTFFHRQGKELGPAASFEAGDVVAWRLTNGLNHIGLVARGRVPGGSEPLVVHNIGQGAQIEDVLHAFVIIGHYRW
jgi:uncharacterized protein YijF (DUF1287 family)